MTDVNPQRQISDVTLLKRYRAGEDDAATAIYSRYAERLLDLARRGTGDDLSARMDAEDVVQSVFRTFFRRASEGHYQIPDSEELWKLLLVIALNKVRAIAEYHRAAKRDVSQTRSLGDPMFNHDASSEDVLRLTIDDVLENLPEPHRRIVYDRIDGYPIEDIATRVCFSKRGVERVLQSFRNRLRKTLEI